MNKKVSFLFLSIFKEHTKLSFRRYFSSFPHGTFLAILLVSPLGSFSNYPIFFGGENCGIKQYIPSRERSHIPPKMAFWVDDVPNFPFGGICDHSLEGNHFWYHLWSTSFASPGQARMWRIGVGFRLGGGIHSKGGLGNNKKSPRWVGKQPMDSDGLSYVYFLWVWLRL